MAGGVDEDSFENPFVECMVTRSIAFLEEPLPPFDLL
jgi:hypothetical protein